MNKRLLLLLVLCLAWVTPALAASPLQTVSLEKAGAALKGGVVEGEDGWLFLQEELLHLGAGKFWGPEAAAASRSTKKDLADPVPAILAYQKDLAARNIELYLLPVPPKALVYPQKLSATLTDVSVDVALYEEFYKVLTDAGVSVIDLLPQLRDAAAAGSQVYCKTDTHFSGQGLDLFAQAVADVLKTKDWYQGIAKREFSTAKRTITITGDLARMAGLQNVQEELELTVVTDKTSGKAVASDGNSPVILLGDSHVLVFNAGGDLHATGAGLFDNVSADLGFPVDLLGVRGSGITPARIKLYQQAKKDPDYLKNKKALIWCFTAREFTGAGGWRIIPPAP